MEEKTITTFCTMAKDDQSDSNIYPCKRKLAETVEQSKEAVDNASKFKKARHPWQIKGISIERNIISQEVKMNEDDPQHMVGVIKYEEKGIVSVNLSTPNADQDMILSKQDRSKNCNESTVDSHGDSDVDRIHPSTSNGEFNSKQGFDLMDKSDLSGANKYSDSETMCTNDSQDASTEQCFEEDNQSSMEHEMSSSNSQRERNIVADNFPTLSFQQRVWLKREMGCAIVDNVFNKTLEEMGLSPDPKVNKFATDRLQILQQGIDAAISQQGLFPQHSRYSQMEHSHNIGDNEISDDNKQDYLLKRRLSLEGMTSNKVTFKRRLSQPLSACGLIYKESLNTDDETVDVNDCIDDETSVDVDESIDYATKEITCEGEINANNMKNVTSNQAEVDACMTYAIDPNSTQKNCNELATGSHVNEELTEGTDECLIDSNETESVESASKYLPDSENLFDLAVSTAIKSQGLSL